MTEVESKGNEEYSDPETSCRDLKFEVSLLRDLCILYLLGWDGIRWCSMVGCCWVGKYVYFIFPFFTSVFFMK